MVDFELEYVVALQQDVDAKNALVKELEEQITAYQVRVDNDALRLNSAHPVTADRFSHD